MSFNKDYTFMEHLDLEALVYYLRKRTDIEEVGYFDMVTGEGIGCALGDKEALQEVELKANNFEQPKVYYKVKGDKK